MRPGLVVGCLVAASCTFQSPLVGGGDGMVGDGDGSCVTFSHQFDTCRAGIGSNVEMFAGGSYRYSTDDGTLTLNGAAITAPPSKLVTGRAGSIRVITATGFTLAAGSSLRVDGGPAFGIAATGAVTIAGTIDASGGAGAQPSCGGSDGGPGTDNFGGGGGGGGGGNGAGGGGGGRGDNPGANVAGGTAGAGAPTPRGPIGGCHGGIGGAGEDPGGAGGVGGGAVYLVSALRVTVSGGINAGGGGGSGGTNNSGDGGNGDGGGGGGGSGGMILLEGPSVGVAGTLAANGGGGGQGAGNGSAGNPGAPGQLGVIAAAGGSGGGSTGTNGGFGGVGGAPGGASVTNSDVGGGGGGGGGTGFAMIDSPSPMTIGAVISPALKPLPP